MSVGAAQDEAAVGLGGHAYDAHPFWDTVGKGTTGGYRQAELCEHLEA
jgi:hypothetical protein